MLSKYNFKVKLPSERSSSLNSRSLLIALPAVVGCWMSMSEFKPSYGSWIVSSLLANSFRLRLAVVFKAGTAALRLA